MQILSATYYPKCLSILYFYKKKKKKKRQSQVDGQIFAAGNIQ